MNVVDSSAWLAYFRGEHNAARFAGPIEAVAQLLVPSICLIEVFRFLGRHLDNQHALEAVAQMGAGRIVPLDGSFAIEAAGIGLELGLPLADSILYATTRRFDAVLWTQDAAFKDLPGVKFFAVG